MDIKFMMDETSRIQMSADDEKKMSDDREHLLKNKKRWILIDNGALSEA